MEIPHALHSVDVAADERKLLFLDTVLPLVLMENERIEAARRKMLGLVGRLDSGQTLAVGDASWLKNLAAEYRIVGDPTTDLATRHEMRRRVDTIPADLALAQAAVETGWGRSRYVRKERDLFGLTGFVPPHARKPRKGKAKGGRGPKFQTLRESVRVYMHTLNSHPAYRNLRQIRIKLREQQKPVRGVFIAEGLGKYSTRGKAYVKTIRDMIHRHDLERYTLTRLTPLAGDDRPSV